MCYGRIVNSIICLIWNTYYTKKIIGYGYAQQMKDLMHILLHSLVMGAIVFGVVCMLPNLWLKLIVGVFAGMAYYIAGAYLMKFEEMQELLLILKRK
jgi:integral membrane sensor domain MASE1